MMNIDVFFRIMLGLALAAMLVIRKYYERRAAQIEKESLAEDRDRRTRVFIVGFVIAVGLLMLSTIAGLIRVIYPPWMAWSALGLPGWLRWAGLLLTAAGTLLLYWTHRTLDLNFFGGAKLRQEHRLITDGPYRLARHPMYTAFLTLGLGYGLVAANWFIGLTWLISTVGILFERLHKEEIMLLEQFGDEYREYMKKTGRFLPRVKSEN